MRYFANSVVSRRTMFAIRSPPLPYHRRVRWRFLLRLTVQVAYYNVLEVNYYLIRYSITAAVDCDVERIVRLDEKEAGMERVIDMETIVQGLHDVEISAQISWI
jgi:hypothetical protein